MNKNNVVRRSGGIIAFICLLFVILPAQAQVVCTPDTGYTHCRAYIYTGGDQVFTVPDNLARIKVKAWGAGGGGSIATQLNIGAPGGAGGYVEGMLEVTPGSQYAVVTGGGGGADGTPGASSLCNAAYGFGGACPPIRGANYIDGGGGGGLSGLFTGSAPVTAGDNNRAVFVAGGGGAGEGTSACGSTSMAGGAGGNAFAGAMPTMQGAQGAYSAAISGPNPTGGGGGYFGGDGTDRLRNGPCGFSANGGSNFIAPTGVSGAVDLAGSEAPSVPHFSANNPPGTGEPQYQSGVGVGQLTLGQPGGHGLVVVQWVGVRYHKSVDPVVTEITPGQTFTYTVTVENIGDEPMTALSFADGLSGVIDDATYDGNVSADVGSAVFNAPDEIAWSGDLAPSQTATITYSVTVNDPLTGDGLLVNGVTGTGPDANCTEDPAVDPDCFTVTPLPDIRAQKSLLGPADPQPGDVVNYEFTIINDGDAAAANVSISDDLSGVLDDAVYDNNASAPIGSVSFNPTTRRLTWNGSLAAAGDPGDSVTVTYSVTVNEAGDLGDGVLQNAIVSAGCPNPPVFDPGDPAYDPDCVTGTPVEAWTVHKTVFPGGHAQPGEVVVYTITVENTGGTDLTGLIVEDDLTGVLGSADYNNDESATGGNVSYSDPVVTWTGDLAAGQTVTITYSVTVDDPLTSGAAPQVFSGTAQAWTTDSTWQNNIPGNSPVMAINAPDGNGVQLWSDQNNSLALDMANVVPAGETVVLHLGAPTSTVFQGDVLIESSTDGVSYGNPVTFTPTDILPAYGEYDYTVPAGGARFIRITPQDNGQSGTAVRVDALTYAYEFLERAGAVNLVQQGSFEGFTECSTQSGTFGAWTVAQHNIHIYGPNCPLGWPVPDGVNSIDLDGNGGGSGILEQDISGLTPGETYNLTFYMAFNPAAGAAAASMRLTIADFDDIYTSASNATIGGFNRVHVTFTAQNTSETLRFESLTGSGDPNLIGGGGTQGFGVVFDVVRITPQSDLVSIGDANLVNAVTGSLNCPSPPVTDPDDPNFNPDCVTITPLAGIELFKTASPGQATPGTTVSYTFTAINTGSLPLTDVVISETGFSGTGAISALDCTPAQPAVLDPEDILECTATYVVQQDDVDAGVLTNTAQVIGIDPNDNGITDEAEAQVQVLAPPASTCNLAANGSFEIPNIQTEPQRPGENTAFVNGWAVWRTTTYPIDGWETVSGTVDFLRHYNNASDGAQSIDLLGTASATFQQTFTNLTPGQSYAFSIDYSGHSTTDSQADVLLDQGTGFQLIQTLSPVADSVNNGTGGIPNTPAYTVTWATFSHTFVAAGTEATIRFVNTGSLPSTGLFIDNFVFEGQAPCEDFGDAPASYGTLLADNGARHEVIGYDPAAHTALLMLGPGVGLDPDGQPDPAAALDDFDDGVVAASVSLVTGATTASVGVLAVNATADDATLAGWIDFDDSGTFDTDERAEVTVPANTNTPTEFTLDWSGLDPIPADFQGFARFRIATDASEVASPVGAAGDGEVEDYVVPIVQPAQITIIKLPTAQDGTIFPFTTTAEAPDDAFELSSDTALSYPFSVLPGTVSVTETAVADWVISDISCVDESGNAVFTYTGAPGDPSDDFERGDDTVNITIDGGEATCTFTNAPTALPTLAKYFNTDPASDPPPAEPPVIPRGGTALLTFVIANTQPTSEDQTGLGFTDTLPPGLVLADGDSPPDALVGANTCGGTVTAQAGTAAITLAGGAVTANAECSFTVRVTTAP